MPLIDISLARGRTPEQLRALIHAVNRAAETTVDAAPENITVIVREVEHEHWSRGNTTIAERAQQGATGSQSQSSRRTS